MEHCQYVEAAVVLLEEGLGVGTAVPSCEGESLLYQVCLFLVHHKYGSLGRTAVREQGSERRKVKVGGRREVRGLSWTMAWLAVPH